MYQLQAPQVKQHHVQILGGGAILLEVIAAGELLERDFSVSADIWMSGLASSATRPLASLRSRSIARQQGLHP